MKEPRSRSSAKTKKHAKKIVHHAKKVAEKSKKTLKKTTQSKKPKAIDSSKKLRSYSAVSKRKVKRDLRSRKKAEYLATLPKSRIKRFFYRLHPKRLARYWFSKRGAKMAGILALGSLAFLVLLSGIVFAYFRRDLPNPNELSNRILTQTTKFYDRTGETLLFEVYGDQRRTVVGFDEISEHIKNATVAIEDKDFYEHGGFSTSGIVRAAWSNVVSGDSTGQGGSTITQQFIKNSLLTREQTYTRKLKELILAVELERLYTKDEILAFYLNEIAYGGISYGIEAASLSYFEKNAKDLTIDEASLLAAMPQAPGDYSPYGPNTDLLVARQAVVIDAMRDQGYITSEEADEAREVETLKKIVPLEKQSAYKDVKAPHFVELVKDKLVEEFGRDIVENGGLKVITTVDLELQELAEKAVAEGIDQVVSLNGDNAALSASDVETGQVLAQVGSRDFFYPEYGRFNAASPELGRQPGSSFKPYSYAEMFKSDRWGPGSLIWDSPTDFSGYKPDNFDFRFPGKMKVREALGRSRNIPAVKSLYIAGVDNTIELARTMGMKSLCNTCDYGLSLVLGSGEVKLDEHVHAYSTFARGGTYKEQTYVLKIENARGEVIKEWQDEKGEQVLDPQIAYLVTDMLKDDAARAGTFGLGNRNIVVPGLNLAAKTGTTDLSVDGWMMGYSTCLAAGVWVGNHDSKPMNSITSNQTGPIWTSFMASAHEKLECGTDDWEQPEGIKTVTLDANTGRIATDKSRSKSTDIFPSWYKPAGEGSTEEVVIDTVSNKLATDCTPDRARKTVTESGVLPELPETDPFFDAWARGAPYGRGGASSSQEDDVHKCDDKKPTINLTTSEEGDGRYRLSATVTQGTHPLDVVNFIIDGDTVATKKVTASGTTSYVHTFNSSGAKRITVEVVDSVLYEDSAKRTINVNGVGANFEIVSPNDGATASVPVTISWAAYSGADEYKVCLREDNDPFNCETIAAPQTSYSPLSISANNEYRVYVEAYIDGDLKDKTSNIDFET